MTEVATSQSLPDIGSRPGTPGSRSGTSSKLLGIGTPSLSSVQMSGFSPTPTKSRSFISKLQEEYPHLKKLQVPGYAATEWRKEDARLFFESGGTIKPIRAPQGGRDKAAQEGYMRMQYERLRRKEHDVRQLQQDLKVGALKAFSRDEVELLSTNLQKIRTGLSGTSKSMPPKIIKLHESLEKLAGEVMAAVGFAKEAAERAAPPPDNRAEAQVQAMNRRLLKAGEQLAKKSTLAGMLQERMVQAERVVELKDGQVLKLTVENGHLLKKLQAVQAKEVALDKQSRGAKAAGFEKAKIALAERSGQIFALESDRDDLKKEIERLRLNNKVLRGRADKALKGVRNEVSALALAQKKVVPAAE